MFVVILLVVEVLVNNIEGIVASMPEYLLKLDESYGEASALINDPKYAEYIQKWLNGLDIAGIATGFMNSLSGFLANIAVVVVYVIFFIMEDTAQRIKLEKLFPEKRKTIPEIHGKYATN